MCLLHLPSSGLGHSSLWEEPLEMSYNKVDCIIDVSKWCNTHNYPNNTSLQMTSMSGLTCALAVPVSIRKTPPSPTWVSCQPTYIKRAPGKIFDCQPPPSFEWTCTHPTQQKPNVGHNVQNITWYYCHRNCCLFVSSTCFPSRPGRCPKPVFKTWIFDDEMTIWQYDNNDKIWW